MWVDGVEIPAELVDAHRSGRLVLFVGAGASKDPPANLPDFSGLTRSIADQAHYPLDDGPIAHPDVVLGRIKDRGVDVHHLVASQLGDPDSRHNRLHEAIVDLGLAGPVLRIVTTNFDRHLTSALEARGAAPDEYAAPALPVGNDFTGVVYLHGTLSQPPNRLILTDDDFGTAYLRDAWAARFLERMFGAFTVLFIGYSHGDVVMRYLARSLGPEGHRYVLTATPDAQDWTDLGLRPIGYEVDGTSHAALGEAVARWGEISAMGLLDHRRRVSELVAAPPSGIPEDDSYLEELIADPDRVALFTEFARGPEWLDWASKQAVFKRLLTRGAAPAETDQALARWFVECFVMEEQHSTKALDLVADSGGPLGAEVCHWIGFHLHIRGAPRSAWLGPWLVLLLRDAPPSQTHWLDYALSASTWPDDKEQALLLFDYLTEPTVGLAPSYGLGGARLEVNLRGDDYWLRDAWDRTLRPNLADAAHEVAALADRHLRRIRHLQVGAYPENPDWDSVSFRRSGIEPHPEDRYHEPVDVLIDAARDAIEVLLDAADPTAASYLHTWAAADSQILRRLAIHAWNHRGDVDATAKIDWVVRTGWLFDHVVRHELFRLIAAALPTASDDAIDLLVSTALERDDNEPEHRAYERYNALVWMDRHRPDHPVITSALAEAHAVNPSWTERLNPDLTHSMVVGFVPSRPPMSVEDFHSKLTAGPAELILELSKYKGADWWEGGSTWADWLSLITHAVKAEPRDGIVLLGLPPPDDDVTRAVIAGWSRAELTPEAAAEVLERVADLELTAFVPDLARMLSAGGRTEGHPTDWTEVPGARLLAQELWKVTRDDEAVPGETDWLTRAINHPGGNLAEFWIQVVESDWRSNEETWSGMGADHRAALETMLSSPPDLIRTKMAEVICVSRLQLLFAADPAWTASNVMPLLDWSNPDRARRCWNSFASWGRWTERMLDAGLMEQYLEAVSHLREFDGEHRRFLGHLASIAISSQRNPRDWLPGVIVELGGDDRTRLADEVSERLADLPPEAVEHEWSRWMHEYWTDRLNSVPTELSFDESSAMAGWIPFLTSSFETGVELLVRRPARFREHDNVLRHLERHVDGAPDLCARMIGHLMRSTLQPWWGAYHLREIWPRLRAASDPQHIKVIVEQAVRLELGDPESW